MRAIFLFFLLILSTLAYSQKAKRFQFNSKKFSLPKSGVWEFYDYNGTELEQRYDFTNKVLLYQKALTGADTTKSKVFDGRDTVSVNLERTPIMIGGQTLFYKWIGSKFKYPREAAENGKSGRLQARFIISAEGKLKDPIIDRHFGYGSAEAFLKLINDIPFEWIPGKLSGKNVDVVFTLPLSLNTTDR
jgi:hypothetical protein